jgi:hypothetical protein
LVKQNNEHANIASVGMLSTFKTPKKENNVINKVPLKDIPQGVLDEVSQHLQQFHISIFVPLENPTPNINFIGSGTLIEAYQKHYVLTAAHVWHEIIQINADQIGFALPPYSSLLVPREYLFPKIPGDQQNPDWGPDLALLRLPPSIVGKILAYKTFLNFPKQKATFTNKPLDLDKGLWAFIGMVGEFNNIQVNLETQIINANIQERAFFGVISQTYEHNGYDYFDLNVNVKLSGVPLTFQGVSGGGLWEITWNKKAHIRGVEFGQLPISNNHRMIRCHGPQGIFHKAWEAWELEL